MSRQLILKLEARDTLSEEEKQLLLGVVGDSRIVAAKEDMVREGDEPRHSTLLLAGFAVRYKVLAEGGRQITAIHVPGDFVDLHSFLLKKMDHSVAALSECRIAPVAHESLGRITENQPHLTRMLWLSTLIDGAIHREWLVGMGRRTALSQTAHLLCELNIRLGIVGEAVDNQFVLPITQIELGDTLGLSSVHVNRVLQELRADGLINWRGQKVAILDWEGLQAVAEFDARFLHLDNKPR